MKATVRYANGLSLIYSDHNRMDEFFARVENVINNPDPNPADLAHTYFNKLMLRKLMKEQPDQMERGNLEIRTCHQELESIFLFQQLLWLINWQIKVIETLL